MRSTTDVYKYPSMVDTALIGSMSITIRLVYRKKRYDFSGRVCLCARATQNDCSSISLGLARLLAPRQSPWLAVFPPRNIILWFSTRHPRLACLAALWSEMKRSSLPKDWGSVGLSAPTYPAHF